jgi:hypothetical protein
MNENHIRQVTFPENVESGPTAIGEILPAVLARFGLDWDEPWDEVAPAVEMALEGLVPESWALVEA